MFSTFQLDLDLFLINGYEAISLCKAQSDSFFSVTCGIVRYCQRILTVPSNEPIRLRPL